MMAVTASTWVIALSGLVLITVLMVLQSIAVLRPYSKWTIQHVYGGSPDNTDPTAYFAFNRGFAIADAIFWGPLQITASIAMLAGERWGFLLALIASVPFWYSAILFFIWDRDMGFRQNSWSYWVFVWGVFPLFGVIEMVYCFVRLV